MLTTLMMRSGMMTPFLRSGGDHAIFPHMSYGIFRQMTSSGRPSSLLRWYEYKGFRPPAAEMPETCGAQGQRISYVRSRFANVTGLDDPLQLHNSRDVIPVSTHLSIRIDPYPLAFVPSLTYSLTDRLPYTQHTSRFRESQHKAMLLYLVRHGETAL